MDKYYPFHLTIDENALEIKQGLIADENVLAFFDTRYLICHAQIKMAMFRATRSFNSNKAIANIFNLELMLHLAGTHQIKIAIDLFDLQSITKEIVIIGKTADLNLANLKQGFPLINPNDETLEKLGLNRQNDVCKEIISLGARLVTDYE